MLNNEQSAGTIAEQGTNADDMHVSPAIGNTVVVGSQGLPKIFAFINGANALGYMPVALSEDGECLAGHCSSNEYWAKHDIGVGSDWKHEKYKGKYPQGYNLIWLEKEDCETNEDFKVAIEKANNKPTEK